MRRKNEKVLLGLDRGAQGAVKALNKIRARQVMQLTITMYPYLRRAVFACHYCDHRLTGEKDLPNSWSYRYWVQQPPATFVPLLLRSRTR